MPDRDPDALLADLDPVQREAVRITSGPLCILAGAGSGKTRVISRRVAYALATDVVRPREVLVVTFTDKAAGEMRARLAALGHPGVAASTFHAAALRQRGSQAATDSSRSATSPVRSSGRRRVGSQRTSTRCGPSPTTATLRCRPT